MNKKRIVKYSSIGLCSALLLSGVGTYCLPAYAASPKSTQTMNENKNKQVLKEVLQQELHQDTKVSDKDSKNEIVYVFTDVNGKQNKVLSSVHLNNASKALTLKDQTSLSNIENMTGDEAYYQDDEGNIIWNSQGKSITYQGTTDKAAPITMRVSYFLNGKEVSAKELAGKSGHVKVRYNYTNNLKTTVTVDGKKHTVPVPLTMLTGIMLDQDKFSNVEVTNGKIMQMTDSQVVLGMAMPGLEDAFDVNIDIPDYFEFSADVKDFELEESMSVATSNLLSDINVDDISLASLQDKMKQLQDGSNQLVKGTEDLQAGTQTLYDKAPVLQQGVHTLYTATTSLVDATSQLFKGSDSLNDKMKLFASKLNELYDTLHNKQLDQNVAKLNSGAKQINDGINSEAGLISTLEKGMNEAKGIYNAKYNESYQYLVGCLVKEEAIKAYCSQNQVQAPDLSNPAVLQAIGQYVQAIQNNPQALQQIKAGLLQQGISEAANIDSTLQDQQNNQLTAISGGLMKAYASLASTDTNGSVLKETTAKMVMMNQANATYKTLLQSYNSIKLSGLSEGIKQLSEGLNTLNTSVGSFETYQEGTLCSSLYALKEAANQLNSEGTAVLNSNLATLATKSKELNAGTATLNDAAGTLVEGVQALNTGAITLKNGMATFNQTGIETLSKLVEQDANNALGTVKAIVKAGQEYQSFTGKNKQMKGTVEFIYQTKAIHKD